MAKAQKNTTVAEAVAAAVVRQPGEFERAFDTVLRDKIFEAVAARKLAVAESLFTAKETEESVEVGGEEVDEATGLKKVAHKLFGRQIAGHRANKLWDKAEKTGGKEGSDAAWNAHRYDNVRFNDPKKMKFGSKKEESVEVGEEHPPKTPGTTECEKKRVGENDRLKAAKKAKLHHPEFTKEEIELIDALDEGRRFVRHGPKDNLPPGKLKSMVDAEKRAKEKRAKGSLPVKKDSK